MELDRDGSKIVEDCLQAGMLINCTAHKVLRFLPPLTVSKKDLDRGLTILEKVLTRQ
jgi:4-aminobutyrate aminotransferase-like enzyme